MTTKYLPTASEGWGKVMFSHVSVHPSIRLSVHTPTRTGYTAVGMPLAFTQEDFLVAIKFSTEIFYCEMLSMQQHTQIAALDSSEKAKLTFQLYHPQK